MSDQRRLETSLLDLAAEIFQLKSSLASVVQQNESMAKLLNSIRASLTTKGLISEIDISSAIELAEIEAVADSLQALPGYIDLGDDDPTNH